MEMEMKRLAPFGLAALASFAFMAPGAAAAADLALVIGNQDYQNAPDAVSARADTRAVANALAEHGYEVTLGTDLDRAGMRGRIAEFAARLDRDEAADRVVVFYSGHTLTSGGINYLAPVDQGNDSLIEVMMDGVPLDLVLRLAGQEPGEAVVFIDGAQLSGFTAKAFAEPGLADIEAPDGVLVVSAAAPDRAIARRSTGQSVFGRQVVDRFLAPGVRVSTAARELGSPTWVTGDTDSRLVLMPETTGRVRDRVEADTREDPDAAAPDQGAAVEQRLALTKAERQTIQQNLTTLGYDTRGVDGIFGPGTRSALRRWQRANDLRQTGYLTSAQVALLSQQAVAKRPADTDEAQPAQPDPADTEAALELSRADRLSIEQRLSVLGFAPGQKDGSFDASTRRAIANYQRSRGHGATGYLDRQTVTAIMQETRDASDDIVEGAEALLNILRSLDN
jgi:peptidoglycan hydrolase-like protein with peptidoglycan-binding domain